MSGVKLTKLQKDILGFFGRNDFGHKFYWTGGTLLAYRYLNNRQSVDIDFFSEELFLDDEYLIFMSRMKDELKIDKLFFTLEMNRRQYIVTRKNDNVKLEMVYFPFPALGKRGELKEFGVKKDSLLDLMSNKILAAYQRHEPKDVFDLYSYLTNKPSYNLSALIEKSQKKFGVDIESLQLYSKLNELANELSSLMPLLIKKDKDIGVKVKKYFQKQFNGYMKNRLGK